MPPIYLIFYLSFLFTLFFYFLLLLCVLSPTQPINRGETTPKCGVAMTPTKFLKNPSIVSKNIKHFEDLAYKNWSCPTLKYLS